MVILKSYDPSNLPEINLAEVARYAGGGRDMTIPDSLLSRVAAAAAPRVCYGIFDLSLCGDTVKISGVGEACSRSLSKCLSGCDRAIVFASTLGHGVDRLIRGGMISSPSEGCIMGAVGSERAEALCNRFSAEMECLALEEGCKTRPRFSPGYGDLSLEFQKEIFRALDVTRNIGVSLGEGYIMTPEKSVTAIIGIEQRKK